MTIPWPISAPAPGCRRAADISGSCLTVRDEPNPKPRTTMTPNPSPNHQHPRVEVDFGRLLLVIKGPTPCEIDLERCTDPARLLHLVLHVSTKPWCDRALAGEMLAALETACRTDLGRTAQEVYCPSGRPQRVDWDAAQFVPIRYAHGPVPTVTA